MAKSGHDRGDEAFFLALAGGKTIKEAAKLAGISQRTATRRLSDPAFRRQIAEARAELMEKALGKLASAAAEAVDTLRKLLKAEAESARLGAARSIIELAGRLRASVELEERLRALEEHLSARDDAFPRAAG